MYIFQFLVSCLLISSGLAAPQQFFAAQAGQGSSLGSHSSQTVRTPFGTLSSHSKTVAEADGTSHVHRFDTRHHGQGVVRVARPRLVQSETRNIDSRRDENCPGDIEIGGQRRKGNLGFFVL
mgnify:CR=1 FL=1